MSDPAREWSGEGRRYTYADYKNWELSEGERYELIDGTPYAMAAPNDAHQAINVEMIRQIANYLRGKPCKVRPAPYDVRLFYAEDESDDTVVQPDISVICGENKRGPEGGRGAPSLVVEILSPSNTSEEYVRKLNLYLKAGVPEYWVVSPAHKTVQVFLLREGTSQYKVYEAAASVPSAAVEGLIVNLAEVFGA